MISFTVRNAGAVESVVVNGAGAGVDVVVNTGAITVLSAVAGFAAPVICWMSWDSIKKEFYPTRTRGRPGPLNQGEGSTASLAIVSLDV